MHILSRRGFAQHLSCIACFLRKITILDPNGCKRKLLGRAKKLLGHANKLLGHAKKLLGMQIDYAGSLVTSA